MMNIGAIIEGWGKCLGFIQASEAEKALSIERLAVCAGCEHAKESKILEFITGGAEHIDTLYCNVCKCPCHQKSLTKNMCPLGKWDNINIVTNLKTA